MPEVLISCNSVSKRFCRDLKRSLWYGLRDSTSDLLGRTRDSELLTLRQGEFWANEDINFELRRGECLGLIGRNGSGKTTLLKMLNGLIKPDNGFIDMKGQVGALIALGAGFNPVLTGRENIYINGSVLGMTQKQIRERLDSIIEFAEIDDAIDSPVRTYSSGMQVRLGFSIAIKLIKPDILLLDEILAVGDIGFVIKCINEIQKMMNRSAVIFVSHNMQMISRFCTQTLLLNQGNVVGEFPTQRGIELYNQMFSPEESVQGTGQASILSATLLAKQLSDDSCKSEPKIPSGTEASFTMELKIDEGVGDVLLRVGIFDRLRLLNTRDIIGHSPKSPYLLKPGFNRVTLQLGPLNLNHGRYSIIVHLKEKESGIVIYRSDGNTPFSIETEALTWGVHVGYSPAEIESSAYEYKK